VGQPNELGALLADLRKAKGLSLREVEEATGKAVSNPYLSQLENGKIKKPSPNVLHSLAEVYVVPYESLMERAGYLLPSEDGGRRRRRLAAFAIDDLTAEEEEELLKYLAFLRSRSASNVRQLRYRARRGTLRTAACAVQEPELRFRGVGPLRPLDVQGSLMRESAPPDP
jgi:transcriptional regulator with XRE-family HTH domain